MNFQEQISDQKIERSLWFIKNQALIKKIIIITLLIIILILYGFSLLKFINIRIQSTNETKLNSTVIDFHNSCWICGHGSPGLQDHQRWSPVVQPARLQAVP